MKRLLAHTQEEQENIIEMLEDYISENFLRRAQELAMNHDISFVFTNMDKIYITNGVQWTGGIHTQEQFTYGVNETLALESTKYVKVIPALDLYYYHLGADRIPLDKLPPIQRVPFSIFARKLGQRQDSNRAYATSLYTQWYNKCVMDTNKYFKKRVCHKA